MLSSLQVHNLAIVESAAFSPGPGLTVITGETGAGKSILIGALHLLLGQRADKSLIRSGASEANVGAVFTLPENNPARALLDELGLPPCEDGQLVIRRAITPSASRCQINDAPVTLATLKNVTSRLVDLHGPDDQQSLMEPAFQLELLDAFGRHSTSRAAVLAAWQALRACHAQRDALLASSQNIERETDQLRFILSDIEAANLDPGADETLVQRHAESANAQNILDTAGALLELLSDSDASAFSQLAAAQNLLAELARLLPEAADWKNEIQQAALILRENAAAIAARVQHIDADPQRLAALESRMAVLQRLKRKYGPEISDILQRQTDATARLALLENVEAELEKQDKRIAAARENLARHAQTLRAERAKAAKPLAQSITRELRDLGFLTSGFDVALHPVEPRQDGADIVEFLFAPNPGEPARPLQAIASSGEIARVMLAVKSILARHDQIPTLVFDEIDANIGGEVGHKVGQKLALLGKSRQVLCITHLPQVAARGDDHFVVEKRVKSGRAATSVEPLAGAAREREIARMLGGAENSPVVLDHARSLLKNVG